MGPTKIDSLQKKRWDKTSTMTNKMNGNKGQPKELERDGQQSNANKQAQGVQAL